MRVLAQNRRAFMSFKRFRSVLILLLSAAMLISLFACTEGNGQKTDTTAPTVTDSETETAEKGTDGDKTEETVNGNGTEETVTVGETTESIGESTSASSAETTEESEETSSVEEATTTVNDETATTESEKPVECKHTSVFYRDIGGGKCEKVCNDCEKVLSSARHVKSDPDPDDNCNIKCERCNLVLGEGKHSDGVIDKNDNCNLKCPVCGLILEEGKHSEPAADSWVLDPQYPQREKGECSACGAESFRGATTTTLGLTLFSPEALANCTNNKRFIGSVETDESGMQYYRITSNVKTGSKEMTITLNENFENQTITGIGKYIAVLYRMDNGDTANTSFDVYAHYAGKTSDDSATAGRVNKAIISDNSWRIAIFDFSSKDQMDVENGIGWTRFDVNEPVSDGAITDIAFIAFFDSESDIEEYYKTYIQTYLGAESCAHTPDGKWVASKETGKITMHCTVCASEVNTMVCLHSDLGKLEGIASAADRGEVFFTADCLICGAKGAEIKSLNQEMKKVFTAEELIFLAGVQADANLENNGNYGRYSATLVSDDATVKGMSYARFTAKVKAECSLLLNDGANTLGGEFLDKYVAVVYRKTADTVSPAIQLLYNASGKTNSSGYVGGTANTVNDGEWHIAVIDLSSNTRVDITNGIGWTRLDVLDPLSNSALEIGDSIDIAYVGFYSSPEAATVHYSVFLDKYIGDNNCAHSFKGEWTTTGKVNEMQNVCIICKQTVVMSCEHVSSGSWVKHEVGKVESSCSICGAVMVKDCEHVSSGSWTATGNKFEFISKCTVCDDDVIFVCNHSNNSIEPTSEPGIFKLVCEFCKYERESDDTTADGLRLYSPDAILDAALNCMSNLNGGKYSAQKLTDSSNNGMIYVHMELIENTPKETYIWLNEITEAAVENAGPYFAFLYRASSGVTSRVDVFASGSVDGMGSDNGKSLTLEMDGEWHLVIFDFSSVRAWNGTADLQQLRIDIFNGADIAAGQYFDIAYAGFYSSEQSAREHFDMIENEYGLDES